MFTRILFALFIVIVGYVVAVQFKSCGKQTAVGEIADLQEIQAAPVHHYTDAAGAVHAQKQVASGNMDLLLSIYKKRIDSQTNLLKIKDKQLLSITQASTVTTGSIDHGITVDYAGDPCPDKIDWSDQWATIEAKYKDTAWWVGYSLRDTITAVTFWKKAGLFKKALYVDVKSQNPNVHFEGIQAIRVAMPRAKKFGLGVNISYTFLNGQWRPVVGAGIQYNLIRF